MNIAICDDDKSAVSYLEAYIERLRYKDIYCEAFYSGDSLLEYLNKNSNNFQVYFMDIEMPGLNGIKTAELIRQSDDLALIIFITNHKEYVFDVFKALPFRFLSKPFVQDDIDNIMNDIFSYLHTVKRYFFFKQGTDKLQVSFDMILYFACEKRKVTAITIKDSYEFYSKISLVEEQADPNIFMRIHTSYLINMEYVESLRNDEVIMRNSDRLPISRKYQKSVKERYMVYMRWKCGMLV